MNTMFGKRDLNLNHLTAEEIELRETPNGMRCKSPHGILFGDLP